MDRDLSFETLAEVCGIDWKGLTSSGRGALNRALAEIRTATFELEDAELAIVISAKAETYKRLFAGAMLTPVALSKHWAQLDAKLIEEKERQVSVANRYVESSHCETCDGHRMVLVRYRPSFPSLWAMEGRNKRHPELGLPHPQYRGYEDGYEEWLPCGSCNSKAREIAIESVRRFERVHPRRLPPPPVESNRRSVTKEGEA